MTSEDNAWSQSLVTITPEDDAMLREISDTATVSASMDVNLVLDPDDIVYRRSLTNRQFVDSTEADEEAPEQPSDEADQKPKEDADTQTYLQGIPTVHISVEYRDEASQTMYMSTPCPPLKYFMDIMSSMKESTMPELKRSNVATTIISIDPKTPQDIAIDQLSKNFTEEEFEDFESKLSSKEEIETEIGEILHFVIARAFWIDDPTSQTPAETANKATQTYIKFNNRMNIFVIDNEVQTDLSCEPKQSNTMLLTDYWERKNIVLSCLEDTITKGIEVRAVVDDIIDEIIDKSAERIRYPMKEQVIQTIASYKLDGEKEEDVLRKLRLDVVVDPLEASIIVVPLMSDLLEMACDNVSKNAIKVTTVLLNRVLQRTMTIIMKLIELEKQTERKSIDQVLAKRKKKILELLSKKETETISTQTSIVGISEVKKIKKSREVLCSVCRKQSMCQWCLTDQEAESIPNEEIKILRTQDILLAYKPCYIVTKMSEKDENLQPPCPPVVTVKAPPKLRVCSSVDSSKISRTVCIYFQSDGEIVPRESFNEWSYVTDATIMKPCSTKESMSSSSQTIITSLDRPICPTSASYHSTLTPQAANALQILKNTFCNREICITSSIPTSKNYSFTNSEETCTKSTCNTCLSINNINNKINGQEICCTKQICKSFSKLHLPNTNTCSDQTSSRISIKSHGDGFKIIPIYLSKNTCI